MGAGAHNLTISYNTTTGKVEVDPDPEHVHRGDTVSWTSADGPWEVDLGTDGPGTARYAAGPSGVAVGVQIRMNAEAGGRDYKYKASVRPEGQPPQSVDPILIVDD